MKNSEVTLENLRALLKEEFQAFRTEMDERISESERTTDGKIVERIKENTEHLKGFMEGMLHEFRIEINKTLDKKFDKLYDYLGMEFSQFVLRSELNLDNSTRVQDALDRADQYKSSPKTPPWRRPSIKT